jgi:small subunit ribosomal protein SAe
MSELSQKENAIKNLIIGGCHLGGKKLTKQMKTYVYKEREDGVYLFDVNKIYEKIQVAARIIVSISDPETVVAVSGRQAGQRAVYKFSQFTKTIGITGRWSPGMLTNQITKKFIEPRLLIVCDPRVDYNALLESSYVNIPVIALCNTDNNLTYVDCAIPCNNRAKRSLAMIWYILTKEVLMLTGENLEEFNKALPGSFMWRDVEKTLDEKGEDKEGEAGNEEEKEGEENEEDDGEPNDEDFM